MVTLAETRQERMLRELDERGRVVIRDMAAALDVSEMTIRRDLARLEALGRLRRVHGGAVPLRSPRYDARIGANAGDKARAAAKLHDHLPATGILYLDGSTTMLNLVPRLDHAEGVQVATNHVSTFERLGAIPGVEAMLIGGRLDRRTGNLVGPLAVRSLLSLVFDAAFFSAWGVAPDLGPTEATVEDAEVKDLVAGRAGAVYLAVDHSKLGGAACGAWTPPPEKTVFATDLAPSDGRLAPYHDRFREVL